MQLGMLLRINIINRNMSLVKNQLISKIYLCKTLRINITRRFMWKNATKIVGHVPKLLDALEQKATQIGGSVVNPSPKKDVKDNCNVIKKPSESPEMSNVSKESTEKLKQFTPETPLLQLPSGVKNPVKYDVLKDLVLDPNKGRLIHHANSDYSIDKIIPSYQEHNAKIVCLIQNPIPLAGIFTMSDKKMLHIKEGTYNIHQAVAYGVMEYCYHMYRDSLSSSSQIGSKIDKLFTYDPLCRYKYPSNCVHGFENNFPIKQHLLAADTHNIVVDVASLNLPSNLLVTQQYISLTKCCELIMIQKTHGFLLSENIEILLVNENNRAHTTLCKLHANKFAEIMGQLNPDFIGQIPRPLLIAIPIDFKLHSLPEQSMPFYNSYSTVSPCLQKDIFVHRAKVCALAHHLKNKKIMSESQETHFKGYLEKLVDISLKVKNKKITSDEGYNTIKELNQQVICQPYNYNLYPTFIETAMIDQTFTLSWENHSLRYETALQKISLLVQQDADVIFQNKHKYNNYTFDLFIQKALHCMEQIEPNYIENYCNLRKVLTITYE